MATIPSGIAIPNPQKYEKGTFETLRTSFAEHKLTNKWQKNTDINTFRSAIESEAGFASIKDNFGTVTNNQAQRLEHDKSEDQSAREIALEGQKSFSKDLREGLGRAFKPLFKPLEKVFQNLKGEEFVNFGDIFSRGSERFNAGMKEMTNGIGALGPAINSLKTGFNKLIAVFNIFWGGLQLITGVIGRAITGVKSWWTGEEPDERPRSEKDLETDIAETEAEMKAAGMDIPDGTEGSAGGGDISGEVSLTPETLDKIENIVRADSSSAVLPGATKDTDSGIWLPPDVRRDQFKDSEKELDYKEQLEAKHAKLKDKLAKQVAKKELKAKLAGEKKFRLFQLLMMIAKFLVPIGLLIGTFLFLKSKIDDWSEAPFAGITRAVDNVGIRLKEVATSMKNRVTGVFKKMGDGLSKTRIGKFLGMGADDAAKGAASGVDDALKAGANVADDVVKEGAKATAKETFKKVGSQVVRKIPIAGAIAETTIDAVVNNKKFNRLKEAYEAGTPMELPVDWDNPDGEKTMRPMNAEEFQMFQKANAANTAGSVGRGTGAFGGAWAGAAAGAAIGSIIPGVGTVIGGVVGGILGGFFGGRAGDKIATDLVANAQGIESPQELIDMYAKNLPELAAETGGDLANANAEVLDTTSEAGDSGSGGTFAPTTVTSNSSTENTEYREEPGTDLQLAYALGHPGAARP